MGIAIGRRMRWVRMLLGGIYSVSLIRSGEVCGFGEWELNELLYCNWMTMSKISGKGDLL
jgi:hypothetical protein